jgi:hypothetical protein
VPKIRIGCGRAGAKIERRAPTGDPMNLPALISERVTSAVPRSRLPPWIKKNS